MRLAFALAVLLLGGCAAPSTPAPASLTFAQKVLERAQALPPAVESAVPSEPGVERPAGEAAPTPAARTPEDELRHILDVSEETLGELRTIAADEEALSERIARPIGSRGLAALAWLRSPAVRAARANYEAARTAYTQSRDLDDLVSVYRSFTRDTMTAVGPERSRKPVAAIAPSPNVGLLSAEVAHRSVEMAFETLRATVRETVAASERAFADAARLHEARGILREEVELDTVLLEVLRARLESGKGSQAGFLAFEARLERLRTELAVLDLQATVVRAAWNRLLARPEAAPVALDVVPEDVTLADGAGDAIVGRALAERQELRSARLAAERAALALRLAETMTLPRFDLGSSRFERERAGEAGAQRGTVFQDRPRAMPRYDFGVREAQVREMRNRREAAERSRDALRDRVASETRAALFAADAARRRVAVHEERVVPLARQSLEAARGAYEGNRTGYLDLLDAVRRLLDARLGLADARRDLSHAHASLLTAVGEDATTRR